MSNTPYKYTTRIILPGTYRDIGDYLGDAKVYSELVRHYWWPKVRSDITHWSKHCLMCTTYGSGRTICPPLTLIPVLGPLDQVGIDVIKSPVNKR